MKNLVIELVSNGTVVGALPVEPGASLTFRVAEAVPKPPPVAPRPEALPCACGSGLPFAGCHGAAPTEAG